MEEWDIIIGGWGGVGGVAETSQGKYIEGGGPFSLYNRKERHQNSS